MLFGEGKTGPGGDVGGIDHNGRRIGTHVCKGFAAKNLSLVILGSQFRAVELTGHEAEPVDWIDEQLAGQVTLYPELEKILFIVGE